MNNDIALSLATYLEDEFRFLVGKSDIDEKHLVEYVKTANAAYKAEYVTFGLIEFPTMFDLLGLCVKDFSGHRADEKCRSRYVL